jgi:DNA sulfur modification protein DndE
MNFRLKTSKITGEKLKQLQSTTNLTPNILVRIAIGLSLRQEGVPNVELSDNNGLEFNRNTLTGEYDYIFKALITQHSQKELTEAEYFPDLFNAHLERGVRLLSNEYQHAGNSEKLMINLLQL